MPVKVILNFIVGNCDGNYRYQYFRFPWRLCKSSEIKRKSFLTRFPCTTQYQHELVPFGHIDALIGNQLGWHCVSFADREQCECLASGNHHFCCPMRGIMYINIENYHPTPNPQSQWWLQVHVHYQSTMHPHSHFYPHLHLVCVCVYVYLVVCVSNAIIY